MDVPVQYYQSIIGIEVAVAVALLFKIRFFGPRDEAEREGEHLPDPRLRLLMAIVLNVTIFGSLAAMLHDATKPAAVAVTVGLALSLLPILLRTLPRLTRHPDSDERDPNFAVTIVGLILYVAVTAGAVVLVIA